MAPTRNRPAARRPAARALALRFDASARAPRPVGLRGLLLFAPGLLGGLLGGCADEPAKCFTDRGCGAEAACLKGTCVGTEVDGDPRALYEAEFRLRLEMECGICHHDGYTNTGVVADDGRWRLYRGADLRADRVELNWLDLQQWIQGEAPDRTSFYAFAVGAGTHPVIWADPPTTGGQKRILNWLWLFDGRGPRPDQGVVDVGPPVDLGPPRDADPDDGVPPVDLGPRPDVVVPPLDMDVPVGPDPVAYAATVHDVFVRNCNGCHGGSPNPGDTFFRLAQSDAANTYREVLDFVNVANPTASPILARPAGGNGHLVIWSSGDAGYETVLNWIRGN